MSLEARKKMQEMNLKSNQDNNNGHDKGDAELAHGGLASPSDFTSKHKTNTYRLLDDNLILYQALALGDFISLTGTPIDRKMIELGLDSQNQEAREEYESKLSSKEMLELQAAEEHLSNARRVIAKSVVSVKFSDKPQHLCENGVVSLDLISDFDIVNLYADIMSFSKGDEKIEDTFHRIIAKNQARTPKPDSPSTRESDTGESAENSTDG